ncbi:hypothetical protein D9758_013535 [Tetrapyrgos nigripes]|uniref:Uncharacterized protein n=1 Tax=Tetrapyrgos nigripes TaxID=182062 RepID=A0A8H5CEV6_9AGAR|nr:hypothetical protein D9758_013535 [Tetrapyrgos nigripes]
MPSSIDTVIPEPSTPIPPSPTEDYDLGKPRIWESDDDHLETPTSSTRKGKARQYDPQHTGTDAEDSEALAMSETNGNGAYPPVNDEEAETRRVEETLRRWELAERQRRKTARESTQSYSKPPPSSRPTSLIPDVSSLWGGTSQSKSRQGLGNHTALPSDESAYHLPLDSIPNSPGISPGASPSLSPVDSGSRSGSGSRRPPEGRSHSEDPFANPSSSPLHPHPPPSDSEALSPFADSHQAPSAVMDATNEEPEGMANGPPIIQSPQPERPTLLARQTTFSKRAPPTPRPLGLPPPKTPPPTDGDPAIDTPPRVVSPPNASVSRSGDSREEYQPEVRWWHEWLCGCGEGPDRGGNYQAGRTNPME